MSDFRNQTNMKQIIREYLTFSKRERNGIFVLLAIILVLICYLNSSDKFITQKNIEFSKFENEILALNSTDTLYKITKRKAESRIISNASVANITYFQFNPNHLPEKDWRRLGLSDKQISSIKKYESKGGEFRKKEDLKKMYVISTKLYEKLEPHIVFSIDEKQNEKQKEKMAPSYSRLPKETLELNSADSAQLTELKGIGPFYAKAIIKYRNQLGGFASVEQLLEVWKFDQEKYELVKEQVTLDPSKIKKININTCTAKELKHPYLNWKIVNAVINFRSKHGSFHTLEEIKQTAVIDEKIFLKLLPYLSVE